jgi:ATP-binding cassette subfamily F protein 3
MLQAHQLSKHMGSRTLFEDLSFQLQRGARVGMVGPNGAGKTTLMRLLAGDMEADGGRILCGSDETVGYLPQEAPREDHGTVLQRVMLASRTVHALQQELTAVELRLTQSDGSDATELSLQHALLLERFMLLDGYTLEARATEILTGLGFAKAQHQAPLKSLSGGWWMRVELARILLVRPDYLLLDEPTNHLDLQSLAWLEQFLKGYPGAAVVVSHDRYFLNSVVQDIAELSADGLLMFNGNYEDYLQARTALAEQQAHTAETRAKKLKDAQAFIDRFRSKASKARQVQSRVKSLQKQGLDGPVVKPRTQARIHMVLPACPRSGDVVASLREVHKCYGEKTIYQGLNLTLRRGDKVALLGDNGAGKSTLLKMLAQKLAPTSGEVNLGHQVLPYYFAQHQLDILDRNRTVYQELESVMPQAAVSRIRGILGAFLFDSDAVQKKVAVLSGGEKSRLALARMLAQPCNFLLLDEPTNHLDLQSRDVLEDALSLYTGTLVFISHDRYFINRLAKSVLHVCAGGRTEYHLGDYDYYRFKMAEAEAVALSPAASAAAAKPSRAGAQNAPAPDKTDPRAAGRAAAKRHKQAARLEARVAELEAQIQGLDTQLSQRELYDDAAAFNAVSQQRAAAEADLLVCMQEWEEAVAP